MAIDTNPEKLSLIDWGEPWSAIALGGDSIDQGDQQHLLDGYAGILWEIIALAIGKMNIAFTAKIPKTVFTDRQPGISYTERKPNITFS